MHLFQCGCRHCGCCQQMKKRRRPCGVNPHWNNRRTFHWKGQADASSELFSISHRKHFSFYKITLCDIFQHPHSVQICAGWFSKWHQEIRLVHNIISHLYIHPFSSAFSSTLEIYWPFSRLSNYYHAEWNLSGFFCSQCHFPLFNIQHFSIIMYWW